MLYLFYKKELKVLGYISVESVVLELFKVSAEIVVFGFVSL